MDIQSEPSAKAIGEHLREWRQRRHLSQLALACEAEISQKHLCFLENGRAMPSRDMVLHLAEQLSVPLRARNTLLKAAGFAPVFPAHEFQDASMRGIRRAVSTILDAMDPYPALAIDRHWNSVMSNAAARMFIASASPALLQPPVNLIRLSLHPDGLASQIVNLKQWRDCLLDRLRKEIDTSGEAALADLLAEVEAYPTAEIDTGSEDIAVNRLNDLMTAVAIPLQIARDGLVLSFLSTTTVFGTPTDATVSELALESFLPANAETAAYLRAITPKHYGDKS